ncbi:MAG TPA: GNAT family N-acetyltransferase [Candidatus Acidoferrum sp.]|jgi:RimJ/RimL family protein N-acetyltransferase
MNLPDNAKFLDGVIYLRPLGLEDAVEHLAGEDEEMATWVSGGRSTLANVEVFLKNCEENWRVGGPRRVFGVCDYATGTLIGFIEVNLTFQSDPENVNISYGISRPWRGRGLASRAINLMGEYLRTETEVRQMVLRIAPANAASLRVAEKSGFSSQGIVEETQGPMIRWVRDLRVQ